MMTDMVRAGDVVLYDLPDAGMLDERFHVIRDMLDGWVVAIRSGDIIAGRDVNPIVRILDPARCRVYARIDDVGNARYVRSWRAMPERAKESVKRAIRELKEATKEGHV